MGNKFLDLNDIKLTEITNKKPFKLENISKKDIAVIGISARIASSENIVEFWEGLKEGKDFIRDFPEGRKNTNKHPVNAQTRAGKNENTELEYVQGGFLETIDEFDCNLFNISPKEAGLMDPSQRLFLEASWGAVEDAGYGGKRLQGTRTGVYVGHSSDFGEEYKRFIQMLAPSSVGLSIPGNIKSIIGSRISYLLDLKGPSIIVDTACSSSLISVHLACQGMRNGECDMAIAGGVKINLLPVKMKKGQDGIGIESSDGRARTFDASSDGTGMGEGVGAVLLKPLHRALNDGDHIYAVIKGSAINQDGRTMGITAPNSAAQEDVILRAWKDAGVDPETITYIEAHGTGTKLGDPIEVSGIQRAFKNYTEKKQFCAIGSIKTNVGHLDNGAGISAFIKAVLSLKNKQIPPMLHFKRPNHKIDFENSAVYVNDRLVKWETDGVPRRCGVSSFGLSGTNCHLILEEAPEQTLTVIPGIKQDNGLQVLTLSAKSKDALSALISRYRSFIEKEADVQLEDICCTANTGREHYNYRFAIISRDKVDFKDKIEVLCQSGLDGTQQKGIYYGEHKLVTATKGLKYRGEVTEEEKRNASREANEKVKELKVLQNEAYEAMFNEICRLYIDGADINWEEFCRGWKRKTISLPVYPFERKKCWIEPEEISNGYADAEGKNLMHPLIDTCLADSMGIGIYSTSFSINRHWELREHKVFNSYVLPGTTYLEIAREIGNRYFGENSIELRDILFLSPLIVDEGEVKEVQIIVNEDIDFLDFKIASKAGKDRAWVKHAEGRIHNIEVKSKPWCHLEEIKERLNRVEEMRHTDGENVKTGVEVGPRFWNLRKAYIGTDEMLAYLELPQEFYGDLHQYTLHPSLMDSAVNMANPSLGQATYLPLFYKSVRIYGSTPGKFYSYLRKKNKASQSIEAASFNITLADENGSVFAEIENYTVKKVHETDIKPMEPSYGTVGYYNIGWVPSEIHVKKSHRRNGIILIFKWEKGIAIELVQRLKRDGLEIIEVEPGSKYEKISENSYRVNASQEGYNSLMSEFKGKQLTQIIHLLTTEENEVDKLGSCKIQETGLYSLFYLTRALISCKINLNLDTDLVLISRCVNEVSEDEKSINPLNAAMFGLGRVVTQEYQHLICRCIDIDDNTTAEDIVQELANGEGVYQTAYRSSARYIQEFKEIDNIEVKEVELNETGVYVITGGAGGLGLEIGKYLAAKGRINLALIGRSSIPTSDEWDSVLEKDENKKLHNRINAIRRMKEAGANVEYYQADVSEEEELKQILNGLRKRHGGISGIIHCAGVAGDGFIIKKDEEQFNKVIAPKIQGTWLLDRLTRDDNLDFFVMFSSVTAFLSGAGQGDYAAANSYMDSYAALRSRQGKRTLTINWPAWRETGMALDYGALDSEALFKPIGTAEGLQAFNKALNSGLTRVIPAEMNLSVLGDINDNLPIRLSESIKSAVKKQVRKFKAVRNTVKAGGNSRDILLKGKSKGEYTELEHRIAGMWGVVLGLKEVDIYDNFNDLGGDSILSTSLLKEMEKEFTGLIDISDIFTYSTIAEMAQYITGEMGRESNQEIETVNDDIESILVQLAKGEITISDANRLVNLGDDE